MNARAILAVSALAALLTPGYGAAQTQPSSVIASAGRITVSKKAWLATPYNWSYITPDPAVSITLETTCTLVKEPSGLKWIAAPDQATMKIGRYDQIFNVCEDAEAPAFETWPDVAVLQLQRPLRYDITVTPFGTVSKDDCEGLCFWSSDARTWKLPVRVSAQGKTLARAQLTLYMSNVRPSRSVRYWAGSDGYWNICIKGNEDIRSSGGRLYCDISTPARANVRMSVK